MTPSAAELNCQNVGIEGVALVGVSYRHTPPRATRHAFTFSASGVALGVARDSLPNHQVKAWRGAGVARHGLSKNSVAQGVARGANVAREFERFPIIISGIISLPIPITGEARSGRACALRSSAAMAGAHSLTIDSHQFAAHRRAPPNSCRSGAEWQRTFPTIQFNEFQPKQTLYY